MEKEAIEYLPKAVLTAALESGLQAQYVKGRTEALATLGGRRLKKGEKRGILGSALIVP